MSHSPLSADGPSTNGDLDPVAMLVGRFETLWFAGQRPALDPLLAEAGAARRAVLIELVHAELELRLKAGEAARVEDYLLRYPELSEDPGVELDLIRAEFRFRSRREQELDLKEFQFRFPRWQLELEQLETPQSPSQKDTQILPAKRDPAVGEWPVIPGMEVLAELGSGGMGIVYKVRQKTLNRYAAVKILRPGAREEERRRFRTEAEAAARLNHPRIARIHEVGECEGQPYLVLEYVEGGNLAQRLDGTPWPIREAAELVLHLAEAVQYAHDQGVLHRDLTPANVLLDSDGLPKISDFGLAKILVSVGVGPTRTEAILGTPSYMSPEQASGAARQVGPATDIYGLGAILYHLLTGRPPFKGETSLETLRQVLSEDPLPPRRLRSAVPLDLETICLKCLEKQMLDRYSSAANLASDLRSFLAGEPIKSRPPSRLRLAWRWAHKHPATTSLASAALLLTVVVASGSLWHSIQLSEALEETKRESARASQNEQRARQTLYASDLRLGYQAFKLGEVFRLDHLLERHAPSATDADSPGFEWRYLSQYRQGAPDTWRVHKGWLDWMGYSPDGLLFATAGRDADGFNVKVWESATRTLLRQIR